MPTTLYPPDLNKMPSICTLPSASHAQDVAIEGHHGVASHLVDRALGAGPMARTSLGAGRQLLPVHVHERKMAGREAHMSGR